MGFTARDFPADDDDLSELRGIGYLGVSIVITRSTDNQSDTPKEPLEDFRPNPRGAWDSRKAKWGSMLAVRKPRLKLREAGKEGCDM